MEDGRKFQAAKARENEKMFKGVIFSERISSRILRDEWWRVNFKKFREC